MALRAFFFGVWALLGAVLSYALLYVFTPLGLSLLASVAIVGLWIHVVQDAARTELIGLAAGPGIFFIVVAASIDSPSLFAVGAVLVLAVSAVYLSLIRRRCAKPE